MNTYASAEPGSYRFRFFANVTENDLESVTDGVEAYLTIAKADPVINWATPAPVKFYSKLSETQLNATSPVPYGGTFVYDPPVGRVMSDIAPQTLKTTFYPTDSDHYNTVTAYVTLQVIPADDIITFNNLPDKTYGDINFNVSATTYSNHEVTFTVGATDNCIISGNTIGITGAGSCTVTAHTVGDAWFNAAPEVSRTFNIAKATPVISWPKPAEITYGTPLSSAQLNATASIPGIF